MELTDFVLGFFTLIVGVLAVAINREMVQKSITIAKQANTIAELSRETANQALKYAESEYVAKNHPSFSYITTEESEGSRFLFFKNTGTTAINIQFHERDHSAVSVDGTYHKNNAVKFEIHSNYPAPLIVQKLPLINYDDIIGIILFTDEFGNRFQQIVYQHWQKTETSYSVEWVTGEIIHLGKQEESQP